MSPVKRIEGPLGLKTSEVNLPQEMRLSRPAVVYLARVTEINTETVKGLSHVTSKTEQVKMYLPIYVWTGRIDSNNCPLARFCLSVARSR